MKHPNALLEKLEELRGEFSCLTISKDCEIIIRIKKQAWTAITAYMTKIRREGYQLSDTVVEDECRGLKDRLTDFRKAIEEHRQKHIVNQGLSTRETKPGDIKFLQEPKHPNQVKPKDLGKYMVANLIKSEMLKHEFLIPVN
jgi:hypothetical protein